MNNITFCMTLVLILLYVELKTIFHEKKIIDLNQARFVELFIYLWKTVYDSLNQLISTEHNLVLNHKNDNIYSWKRSGYIKTRDNI